MNYYKRHLGDYAKDTGHLTALEHGVYTLLLDRYYSTERPIPPADAYKVARARTAQDRAAVDAILGEFFKKIDDEWHHSYADRVIGEAKAKSEKASESANRRWQNASDSQCDGNANASETHNEGNASHKPLAISHKKDKKSRKARLTPLPENFSPSDRVKAWAEERGYANLPAYLEHFVGYVKRSGKQYADWDEALMCAIREDWAKVRTGKGGQASEPVKVDQRCAHRNTRGERCECDTPHTLGFRDKFYCTTHHPQHQNAPAIEAILQERAA